MLLLNDLRNSFLGASGLRAKKLLVEKSVSRFWYILYRSKTRSFLRKKTISFGTRDHETSYMERLENTTNMSREATPSRENDEIAKKTRKAEQKGKKDAAKASQRALTNKARCVEFERATRTQQTSLNNLTTTEPPPSRHRPYEILKGAYVFVEPDLSPGVCSHGGLGFVTGVDKTAGQHSSQ